MKIQKSFILFSRKKKEPSAKSKARMSMRMANDVTQCEWLWEASGSCPEQSLGIAVLQRAVLDLITPGVKERDRDDAKRWISGNMGEQFEAEYALSFSRIVESFTDIPVDEFRDKILYFANQAKESKESADGFRFQRS